jgi:ADP-ribose pyrophosphatase YjhB (NUDIX family)
VLYRTLYRVLAKLVAIFFNLLNILLAGNLPPLGSVCMIVEDEGRYLVLQRPEGKIVFPSGFMRWREHPTQTVRREGKEETGLDLRAGEVVGYSSVVSSHFSRMSSLTLIYEAEVIGGELRGSIEGEPCWLDESELRGRMDAQSRQMVDRYLHYRAQP